MKCPSVLLSLALAAFVAAQDVPKAKITLPAKAKPGAVVKGTLTLTFSEGWHGYQNPPLDAYQNPVTLSLNTKGWKLCKINYPTGVVKDLAGAKAAVYEGEITIPFTLVAPKKLGKSNLEFTVAFQQCNDSTCLPPGTMSLKSSLKVAKT